ncbi:hypothetical protein ACP70R_004097 [Stipagrostis hirtigluma subsp. patula]
MQPQRLGGAGLRPPRRLRRELEPPLRRLSDEQLKAKTAVFYTVPLAVVREGARRTLRVWHFDVQVHCGDFASTLVADLNALTGEERFRATTQNQMCFSRS